MQSADNPSQNGCQREPRPASPSQTIGDVLRAQLAERSNAPAVWVAPQKYRTFSEAFEVVGQIAQALRSQVETSHARIAFAMPRGSAGLFGFLSAVEIGGGGRIVPGEPRPKGCMGSKPAMPI